jgi:hypothetical protein
MSRFTAWLAVALAAGFLVVASVAFAPSTVATLGVVVSIVTLLIACGLASVCRRHPPTATVAVLTAAVSAWTLVACLVFSSHTERDLAFAGSLALVALGLAGLTAHELSSARPATTGMRRDDARMTATA